MWYDLYATHIRVWEARHVFVCLCSIEWVGGWVHAWECDSVCSSTHTFRGVDVVLRAQPALTFLAPDKGPNRLKMTHCDRDQFALFAFLLSVTKYKIFSLLTGTWNKCYRMNQQHINMHVHMHFSIIIFFFKCIKNSLSQNVICV